MAATLRQLISRNASNKRVLNFLDQGKLSCISCKRWLNLQEYQSKKLMEQYDVNVQRFKIVESAADAQSAAQHILDTSAKELVVKAMILAGGRGKGHFTSGLKGGVHLTTEPTRVSELCKDMLGYNLITKQTPADGVKVNKIMVAEALDISRETYFAILMDRSYMGPVMVGSPAGGMDIEEVAEKTPHLIFKEPIDINMGIQESQAVKMAENLGFVGEKQQKAADQIMKLYKLFISVDATQVEINPLGETPTGDVVCFDAKVNFDDNAQFRQREIFAMDDKSESDPKEVDAESHGLSYIAMDGNIACLVNGAGLAMATMDIIQYCGGKPANFLDLGGGVQEHQVFEAFKIVLADEKVKAILVNIFGGIVDCKIIANGIVKAGKELNITMPLVVRLEGMNVDAAKQILAESKLPIVSADDFGDAAQKVVDCLKEN
uniref:Succinate--CoA ligase [GDP-forming] subunit beta, mitochondrial n=1 Tax=Ciona savignyi TaxID=51511 RepID=H2Z0G1_CIOSA